MKRNCPVSIKIEEYKEQKEEYITLPLNIYEKTMNMIIMSFYSMCFFGLFISSAKETVPVIVPLIISDTTNMDMPLYQGKKINKKDYDLYLKVKNMKL